MDQVHLSQADGTPVLDHGENKIPLFKGPPIEAPQLLADRRIREDDPVCRDLERPDSLPARSRVKDPENPLAHV